MGPRSTSASGGSYALVTTYQAGKLVMLRPDGDRLNTHFRDISKPMGLAVDGDRLAIGTTVEIWEYHNAPAVARRLEPAGSHDAGFLPRSSVCTGDIQMHEMAWPIPPAPLAGEGARGMTPSCGSSTPASPACAPLDRSASFTPRWRPPFVSELEPSDRCHLNGLGMVDGKPKYVTALGETDTMVGWRPHKAKGGIPGSFLRGTSRQKGGACREWLLIEVV